MTMDKTPEGAETRPEGVDFYPEVSRSLDSLRHMRLMALLRDMIDAEDGAKTAAALGVSYRTVSRAVRSGTLTDRMTAALERHLLLGGGSAAARQRERVKSMEKRMTELQGDLAVASKPWSGRSMPEGGAGQGGAAPGAAAGPLWLRRALTCGLWRK